MSVDSKGTMDNKSSSQRKFDSVPTSLNRRANRRRRCNGLAQLYLLPGGGKLVGSVIDLSLGGCCIKTQNKVDIQTGGRVEVHLRIKGNVVQLAGVLCNVRKGSLLGIQFSNVSQRKELQIRDLIAELFEID